jgi:hypothetical protein
MNALIQQIRVIFPPNSVSSNPKLKVKKRDSKNAGLVEKFLHQNVSRAGRASSNRKSRASSRISSMKVRKNGMARAAWEFRRLMSGTMRSELFFRMLKLQAVFHS